jgi:hypothetical protein
MPATDCISAIVTESVPWNGAVRTWVLLFTTGETVVKVVPLDQTSSRTAELWYPDGHPTVVAQVGVLVVEPEVGLSATSPGSVPRAP